MNAHECKQGIDGVQRSASLASSVLAMLSIAIGVHHVWRHRGKTEARLEDAVSRPFIPGAPSSV
jgi:hypothetical protein